MHRARSSVSLLAVAALLAVAPRVHAQSASGTWMSSWPGGPPSTGIVPSLWVNREGVGFTLGGTLALDMSMLDAPSARVGYDHALVEFGALNARGAVDREGMVAMRLHLVRPTSGLWLATTGVQPVEGKTLSLLGAGSWFRRGSFTFNAQAMSLLGSYRVASQAQPAQPSGPPDTTGGGTAVDPRRAGDLSPDARSKDLRLLTGAETSVGWSNQRLELETRAGLAIGRNTGPARWGEVSATYWTRPSVSVFGRMRVAEAVPAAFAAMRGQQAMVGVQVAPGRTGRAIGLPIPRPQRFRVQSIAPERKRLEFRITGHTVEVSCDATEWSPTPARQVGSDRWVVDLTLEPGVHRVSIRVDGGEWIPPPGVPTAPDGFGGEVGLVVVE